MTRPENTKAEHRYQPLRKGYPLGLMADACLPLRTPRYATCTACEDVCPVLALHIEEATLRLDDSCLNCGRCAAVCPMGALSLPGFSAPGASHATTGPLSVLSVDCWKVPARLTPEPSQRVPCLGGLSQGRILELVTASGSRPLELLDRGWCATCRAGKAANSVEHPVAASLESARSLLEAAGLPPDRLPRLRRLHLPTDLMPAEIPEAVSETRMSRRGFFSALTAKTTVAIDQVRPLPGTEMRRRRGFERAAVPSRERQRVLLAMGRITQAASLAPLPGLFHRVTVSAACNNHQIRA